MARKEDLPDLFALYAGARRFMQENGNPNQWGNKNPPESVLREDIRREQLYVLTEQEQIRGAFALILGEDPTYREISEGNWLSDAPYGTLHRVAGDGSGGIFAAAVEFALTKSCHLRVDTHADNKTMQRAILRAGFHRCGIIYIADGSPRIAYELTKEETADIR